MRLYGSSENNKRRRKELEKKIEEERKKKAQTSEEKREDFKERIRGQQNPDDTIFVLKKGDKVLGYSKTPGFFSDSEDIDGGELPLDYYGNMGLEGTQR